MFFIADFPDVYTINRDILAQFSTNIGKYSLNPNLQQTFTAYFRLYALVHNSVIKAELRMLGK